MDIFYILNCYSHPSDEVKYIDIGNSLTHAVYEDILTVDVLFCCFDRDNWPFKQFGNSDYTKKIFFKVMNIENIDDFKRDSWMW